MKSQPKILLPLFNVDPGREVPIRRYSVNESFLKVLEPLGILPVCAPVCLPLEQLEYFAEISDGLLLQGGHDVLPEFFGEKELHPKVSYLSRLRDKAELYLIDLFRKSKKPILGVCRGLQILNVAFGGTLYQHQPSQFPTEVSHFPNREADFAKVRAEDLHKRVHKIKIEKGSLLEEIFGDKEVEVNSLHHQALREIGKGLKVSARAEDGVVEACESVDMDKHWILGVQWHPEFGDELDEIHRLIFDRFVAEAKKRIS